MPCQVKPAPHVLAAGLVLMGQLASSGLWGVHWCVQTQGNLTVQKNLTAFLLCLQKWLLSPYIAITKQFVNTLGKKNVWFAAVWPHPQSALAPLFSTQHACHRFGDFSSSWAEKTKEPITKAFLLQARSSLIWALCPVVKSCCPWRQKGPPLSASPAAFPSH